MVCTRKQRRSSKHTPVEAEQPHEVIGPKVQRKLRALLKERRLRKSTIRRSLRERMARNKQRSWKAVGAEEQAQLSAVAGEKLNCPICLELILEPTLTPCGHAFCLPCIEESLAHKHACSLCRQLLTLDQPLPSPLLTRLAADALRRLAPQEEEEYARRRDGFAAREAQRRLALPVQEGDLVDFYVERTWEEGKVVEVKQLKDKKVLRIQSTRNGRRSVEVEVGSRLVAKFRSFTKEPMARSSIFMFEFEEELFNSISNSFFFFLDTPAHRLDFDLISS